MITVEKNDSKLKVTYPDLLLWADEYFKKSEQGRDNIREEENRRNKKKKEGEQTAAAPPTNTLPPDFPLTDERRTVAEGNCPGSDADAVFRKFCAYYRAEGKTSLDWEAEWELWTLREHAPTGSNGSPQRVESEEYRWRQELLGMGKLLGVSKKPGESDNDHLERVKAANHIRLEKLEARN